MERTNDVSSYNSKRGKKQRGLSVCVSLRLSHHPLPLPLTAQVAETSVPPQIASPRDHVIATTDITPSESGFTDYCEIHVVSLWLFVSQNTFLNGNLQDVIFVDGCHTTGLSEADFFLFTEINSHSLDICSTALS